MAPRPPNVVVLWPEAVGVVVLLAKPCGANWSLWQSTHSALPAASSGAISARSQEGVAMWQKQLALVACTAGRSVPWHAAHAERVVPDAITCTKPCTSPWQVPEHVREAAFPGAWRPP